MTNLINTSEVDSIEAVDSSLKKFKRIGWFVLIGGLGGFLLWAATAPLDKGVPISGNVVVASSKKAIQHEVGGTVESIFVKDGDVVQQGDTLLSMNKVQASADAEGARVQYISARITQARLASELIGEAEFQLPEGLKAYEDDADVKANMHVQAQILKSRRASLKSHLSAIQENIIGMYAQIKGVNSSLASKREQQQLLVKQVSGMQALAKEGYYPSNRVSELSQNLAKLNADIGSELGQLGQYKSKIAELKMQKVLKQEDYQNEVGSLLAESKKQGDALESQLKGLDRRVSNEEVKSPVDGIVVGLSVFTKGAVISPGFTLMEVVPKDDSLIVEGVLPTHLIDKVHRDMPVNLMFTAFNTNKTPDIPGVIASVSADRFTDEKTGMPYYKVIAKVSPEGVDMIKDLKVMPGMPVDMFVITGERTMLNYLFKPIFDHLKLSMSEE